MTADAELRRSVALACRVLADQVLVEDILGHVSARLDGHRILVRCRGPQEQGLAHTTIDDVRAVDLDSARIADDPDDRYSVPNELPIHTAILAARPELGAVVHAHPPDTVAASVAGIELTPIFGSYDIPAARLAADGVPTYGRSVLIRSRRLAEDLVATLGDGDAIVLRGHGVVTVGATVPAAVLRALQVERLARMHLRIRATGVTPEPIPAADLADLPDLGSAFNISTMWRHLTAAVGDREVDR